MSPAAATSTPVAAATATPTGFSASAQQGEFPQTRIPQDVIDFRVGQPSKRLMNLGGFREAFASRFDVEKNPDADPLMLQYGAQRGYASFRIDL